jgi:hypothetical protein
LSNPSSSESAIRAAFTGSVEARAASLLNGNVSSPVTATGRAAVTMGWDSAYTGAWIGIFGGPMYLNESWAGFLSLAIRLGPWDRYLRLSAFDQPGCFFADCVLGAEAGLPISEAGPTRVGGSWGIAGQTRFYALQPLRLEQGYPALLLGAQVGNLGHGRNFTFSLTLGASWGARR